MSTIRTVATALAVAAAVVVPATGAAAGSSGATGSQGPAASRPDPAPAARPDGLATTATPTQARVSVVELLDSFLFCLDAEIDEMYPTHPYFVSDCMRGGAPASNGG